MLLMNIPTNLGSKQRIGVKYKDDICGDLWLRL